MLHELPQEILKPRAPMLLHLAGLLPAQTQQHRSAWLPSILISATAVEAFTNDLLLVAKTKWINASDTPKLTTLGRMLETLEEGKAQLLVKFEAIHFALTSHTLPVGQEPFQSLKLLIDIRNKLVHPRPMRLTRLESEEQKVLWSPGKSEEKFLSRLIANGLITNRDGANDWMEEIASRKSCVWALNTVYRSTQFIIDLLDDDPSFQRTWGIFVNPLASAIETLIRQQAT